MVVVSVAKMHTCAISAFGSLNCFGSNLHNQLKMPNLSTYKYE